VQLVLASSSPRRAELLEAAGFVFETLCTSVEEIPPGLLPPRELCSHNARLKARDGALSRPASVVLGADTIVCLGSDTLGKPGDHDDARRMLRALCGRTHEVLTGVCILDAGSNEIIEFIEATRVTFRPVTEVNIEDYLARVHPLDKAGAYAAQEDSGALIKSIEGSFSNVVGLPVERVTEALAALGIRPR